MEMAENIQFDTSTTGQNPHCLACEAMLTDALDLTLGVPEQIWFNRHIASCVACSESFADAQRGAAWLEMLKLSRPEPSASLVDRIIAQTTGAQYLGQLQSDQLPQMIGTEALPQALPFIVPAPPQLLPQPSATRSNLLAFRSRLPGFPTFISNSGGFEPRLALTAAMAFFSIALTLNLTGVHLNDLHARDFKPTSLKHTYFQANAQAVRYYDSLRVVHVLESRVQDLREISYDTQPKPTSTSRPGQRSTPPAAQQQNDPAPEKSSPAQQKPAEKQDPHSENGQSEDGHGVSRQQLPANQPQQFSPQALQPDNKILPQTEPSATLQLATERGGLA